MRTFRRHRDADARRSSAISAAKAILALNLYPLHKRQLLRVALWKLTEAEGDNKYRTRYRTETALNSTDLQHDHVVQQATLLNALISSPESAEELLNCAVACTVGRSEHDALTEHSRLNPRCEGWTRYTDLNLTVIDTLTGEPADLEQLATKHQHSLLSVTPPFTWRVLFDDLNIQYKLSGRRISGGSPLLHDGRSLQIYFHDTARTSPSFSAHKHVFRDFSWDDWEPVFKSTTKGYIRMAPEIDLEREALIAMLQYALSHT